jgi:hypothetical protein
MIRYQLLAIMLLCACPGPKTSQPASSSTSSSVPTSAMRTPSATVSLVADPSQAGSPEALPSEARFAALDKPADGDWSPAIPSEWNSVREPAGLGLEPDRKKRLMDMFSWQEFIALSWPVSSQRTVDETNLSCRQGSKEMFGSPWKPASQFPTESEIGPDNCPRWMTWHNRREILPGAPQNPPNRCEAAPDAARSPLDVTSKVGFNDFRGTLTASKVPSMNAALIDQNGNKVYYDILINESTYHTLECFQRLTNTPEHMLLDFQHGERLGAGGPVVPGATELKFAWRVLDAEKDKDRRSRFIIRKVRIPDDNDPVNRNKNCETDSCKWKPVDVGLVGIHIVHKSRDHAQWIWSTFEQVDNDPDESAPIATPSADAGSKFSFFGNCTTCKHNEPPEHSEEKSQLTRTEEIAPDTVDLNRRVQQMLRGKGSVLQYYELVGTQYDPTQELLQPEMAATPSVLRNTVIEPYVETRLTKIPSCIGCHFRNAKVSDSCCNLTLTAPGRCFADFSFLLGRIECAASTQPPSSPGG